MFDSIPFSTDGAVFIIIILVLLIGGGAAITGGLSPSKNAPDTNVTHVNANPDTVPGASSPKENLQLYTFTTTPETTPKVIQLLPTPGNPQTCGVAGSLTVTGTDANGNCCVEDGAVTNASQCCPGVPTCQDIQDHRDIYGNSYQCSVATPGLWCDAKPVIYLYPKQKTLVRVSLTVPGSIIASIPHYPAQGWKNITAYSSGHLVYEGQNYHELFYEASVAPVDAPEKGLVIPITQLKIQLLALTTKLGLSTTEQDEFLAYWVPKLRSLNSPYVFVSLFDPQTKDSIDHVTIIPKPDTFIQYIFYFKPLEKMTETEPLNLPEIPKRQGFTAVEWGGIIDAGQSVQLK